MHLLRLYSSLLLCIMLCSVAQAEPSIPAPLQPWKSWVLADVEHYNCALRYDASGLDQRMCVWPTSLGVDASETGARFILRARVDVPMWLSLPGDREHPVQELRLNGRAAVVTAHEERWGVTIPAGDAVIEGVFRWASMPSSLVVDDNLALVRVRVAGKEVPQPLPREGRVWLRSQGDQRESVEHPSMDVHVTRHLRDGIPMRLTTRIELQVAGAMREVTLANPLPPGFAPIELSSLLPVQWRPGQPMYVVAKPGSWTLTLEARQERPSNTLSMPKPTQDALWPEEEHWAFEANTDVRYVEVQGAVSVDPQYTRVPQTWRSHPVYHITGESPLRFKEKQRGQSVRNTPSLSLERDLWLSFSGQTLTLRDHLDGVLYNATRLNVKAPLQLGRVHTQSEDFVITELGAAKGKNEKTKIGVELSSKAIDLVANSVIKGSITRWPSIGWDQAMKSVRHRVHIPPGWRVLHATGSDRVSRTWIESWTVLDCFLWALFSFIAWRLMGLQGGILTALTLLLMFPETGVGFRLLCGFALVAFSTRFIREGRWLLRLGTYLRWLFYAVVIINLLSFVPKELRRGVYPHLGLQSTSRANDLAINEPPVPNKSPAANAYIDIANDKPQEEVAQDGRQERAVPQGNKQAMGVGSLRIEKGRRGRSYGNLAFGSLSTSKRKVQSNQMRPVAAQTGPGLPSWRHEILVLDWDGHLYRDNDLRIYWMPPWFNTVLAFLRVFGLMGLTALLLGWRGSIRKSPSPRPPAFPAATSSSVSLLAALAAVFALHSPTHAQALPSMELLGELQSRLHRMPTCAPRCADLGMMRVSIQGKSVRIDLDVHAAAATTLPLPGQRNHWLPQQVVVDGREALALRVHDDGHLWLRVPEGVHRVQLRGDISGSASMHIPLPLPPRSVSVDLAGWQIEGLNKDGVLQGDLQLKRLFSPTLQPEEKRVSEQFQPFFHLEHRLRIDLEWHKHSRMIRQSPTGLAHTAKVLLWPGEKVISDSVTVRDGYAEVYFAPDASDVAWESQIEPSQPLTLNTQESVLWSETWLVKNASYWHVEATGVPESNPQGYRRWLPQPGETLTLNAAQPRPVKGRDMTVDRIRLQAQRGRRRVNYTLTMTVRASRGRNYQMRLPPQAKLEEVLHDGEALAITPTAKQQLLLPLRPGSHGWQIRWREDKAWGLRFNTPQVQLGVPLNNVNLEIKTEAPRVLAYLWGPHAGPRVTFWLHLLVIMAVAWVLSRRAWTPLRWYQWALLGLGLTQADVGLAMMVLLWFAVVAWRQAQPELKPWLFNIRQLALVGLTACMALALLFELMTGGFSLEPDMHIIGNYSGRTARWYVDQARGTLPSAGMLTLPLWGYRALLFVWVVWLTAVAWQWLRWGWSSFNLDGVWKPMHLMQWLREGPKRNETKTESQTEEG